jgi:c-di-GMP-binding flagellar brake protein YcgR
MLLVVLCGVIAMAVILWLILAGDGKSPESRRAAARVQISVPVELETFGEKYSANSQNISGGGMLLHAQAPVKVAQPLQLFFVLPNQVAVEIPAVVCHKRGEQFGVRFDPTHHRRRAIEKWVLHAVEEDHRRAAKTPIGTTN